jgi:hypothetical protein
MRCRRLNLKGQVKKKEKETFVGSAATIEGFEDGEDEEDEQPPAKPKSGGFAEAAKAKIAEAATLQSKNRFELVREWFESIGGVFGVLLALNFIASILVIIFAMKFVPIRIFVFLMWIPAFLHQLLFGSPSSPPQPSA